MTAHRGAAVVLAAGCLALVTVSPAAAAVAVTEPGDAGDLPATAVSLSGADAVATIAGRLDTANDPDMYELCLTGEPFSAATIAGTGRVSDPQLFLFDETGLALRADDDAGPGLQSLLQVTGRTGRHYLAISDWDNDPVNAAGKLFTGFSQVPNGPGAGQPLTDWNDIGGAGGGTYLIELTGARLCGLRDVTAPTISVTAPADGGAYVLGSDGTVSYSCADEDGGSGLATCTGSVADGSALDTGTVGTHTVTVRATDLAGNETTATVTYDVVYAWSGFSGPFGSGGETTRRAGAVLPLEWRLTDASGSGMTSAATFEGVTSRPCGGGAEVAESAAGSGLQDLGDGWWQWNWKTPRSYAGSCREVLLHLGDGTARTARVNFS